MNEKRMTFKKIMLLLSFSFLFVNVLIGLMMYVLYIFDIFDLNKILGNAVLYIVYILFVLSVIGLAEIYLKIRSGNVSVRNRKIIIAVAVILSVAGLMFEYPFIFAEDYAFLLGLAVMFVVFLSCIAVAPFWFRKRREYMRTVLGVMSVLTVMSVFDAAIFLLIMDLF